MHNDRRNGMATQEATRDDEYLDANHREEVEMLENLTDKKLRGKEYIRRSSGMTKSKEDVPAASIESSQLSLKAVEDLSTLYRPSSSQQPFIRLFTLEHGLPIRGILQEYPLTECPSYEALSYTWGSKKNGEQINVNDSILRVQPNLHALLKQLCVRNQQPALWCDALCINQNDLEERNDQVQQMGKIYQRAATVLVWLGPGTQASNTILECLERNWHAPEHWYARTYGDARISTFWEGFAQLCHRQYWKRTWIVQEFLLAKKIQVLCGSKSIPWQAFEHVARKSQETRVYKQQCAVGQSALKRIKDSTFMSLSQDRKLVGEQTLEELLSKYGNTRSSDIRDRVFGLIGLACDGHRIKVDYSQDANRLWATIMLSYAPKDPKSFGRHLDSSLGLRSLDPDHLEKLNIEMESDTEGSRDNPEDVRILIALRSRMEDRRDRRLKTLRKRRHHPVRDINTLRDSPAIEAAHAGMLVIRSKRR